MTFRFSTNKINYWKCLIQKLQFSYDRHTVSNQRVKRDVIYGVRDTPTVIPYT